MTINYITEVTSTLLLNLANSAIVSTLSSAAQSSFVQLTVGVATICYLTRNVEAKPQKEISEMDKLIGRLHSNIFSERYKFPYLEKTKRILTQFPRAEDRKRLLELELYFIEAAKCCEWGNDDKIILLEKFAEILALSRSQENIITEALKLLKTHYQFATAEEVMELLQMIADLPHHDRASVIKYANEWIKKHGCGHSQDLPALIEAIARIKADKKSEEMTEAFLENLDQFFDRNYRLLDNTPEKNRQKIGFLHALAHIKPNLQGKAFKLMKKFIGDENYLFGKIIHPENHITLLDFMSENEEIGEDLAKIAEPYWLLDTKWAIFSQFAQLNKQEQTELAEFLLAVTRNGRSHDDLFELIEEFSKLNSKQKERITKQIQQLTSVLPAEELFTIEEFLFFIENDRENLLEPLVDSVVEYFHAGNPMTENDRAQLFSTYLVEVEEN